jgi:hypothetical protein
MFSFDVNTSFSGHTASLLTFKKYHDVWDT